VKRTITLILIIFVLLGFACSPANTEPGDTTAPIITNLLVSDITDTSAVITWDTDEPADSQVSCGTTEIYATSSDLMTALATNHSVTLTGLNPGTEYHFQVKSCDASGNQAVSDDDTFTTTYIYETGVLTYIALNGGFWAIVSDSGECYDLPEQPFEHPLDGSRVRFAANYAEAQLSVHRWGTLIEIVSINVESYPGSYDLGADWDPYDHMWDPYVPRTISPGLVFESTHEAIREIYAINFDGSNQIRLTNDDNYNINPRWSPDGTMILYSSDIGHSHKDTLYVINAASSRLTRLTYNHHNQSSVWSPDSTKIAFVSSSSIYGENDIYIVNADGSNHINLTNSDESSDYHPAWSPDGSMIAFVSERDGDGGIYIMDADSSNCRRLTNHADYSSLPVWSPDGTKIAFASRVDKEQDIYIINADGSNETRLTHDGGDIWAYPVWSPDGTKIAFTQIREDGRNVYVIDADGSNEAKLTDEGGRVPVWSPDGTKIAYISYENSAFCIYTMNADGSDQTRLTDYELEGNDKEGFGMWSPDGTRIFFDTTRDDIEDLYVIDVDGNNETRLTYNSSSNF